MTFLRHIETAIAAVIVSLAMVIVVSVVVAADRPEAHEYQKFKADHCDVCKTIYHLQWCHARPYNMCKGNEYEYLITEKTNGVTLCGGNLAGKGGGCHFLLNHFGDPSKYWNPNFLPDVEYVKTHNGQLPPDFESHKAEYDKETP